MLRANGHFNKHLQRAWNKYGVGSFTFSIIEDLGEYDKPSYFAKENEWIIKLRNSGRLLFNISMAEGGWGPETHLRKNEIVAKISKSVRATLANPVVREKMAAAKRGKPLSDEHRRNTSRGLSGIKRSDATRAKMSASQKLRSSQLSEIMRDVGRRNVGRTPSNAVIFEIDGISYKSGKAAEIALGITSRQLARMVRDGKAKRTTKEAKKLQG